MKKDRIGHRVNLTLPLEVVHELDRIAAATGKQRAKIIRDWMVGALPVWSRVADGLELVRDNESEGLKQIGSLLRDVGDVAGQMELQIKATRRRVKRKNATT